jgi:hypothetical protein
MIVQAQSLVASAIVVLACVGIADWYFKKP